MTPEWKLFINFCPKSAFHPWFTCRGQIWRKSAVAKLPKNHLVLLTKKPRRRGHFWAPIPPPLNRSRPKFRERCRPLTCACMCTDFAPDRLRFAGLIPERVEKSEYNIGFQPTIMFLSFRIDHLLCKTLSKSRIHIKYAIFTSTRYDLGDDVLWRHWLELK